MPAGPKIVLVPLRSMLSVLGRYLEDIMPFIHIVLALETTYGPASIIYDDGS